MSKERSGEEVWTGAAVALGCRSNCAPFRAMPVTPRAWSVHGRRSRSTILQRRRGGVVTTSTLYFLWTRTWRAHSNNCYIKFFPPLPKPKAFRQRLRFKSTRVSGPPLRPLVESVMSRSPSSLRVPHFRRSPVSTRPRPGRPHLGTRLTRPRKKHARDARQVSWRSPYPHGAMQNAKALLRVAEHLDADSDQRPTESLLFHGMIIVVPTTDGPRNRTRSQSPTCAKTAPSPRATTCLSCSIGCP